MNPLKSFVDIEDTKILRIGCTLEFGRVRIREDTLTSVEANEYYTLASEVVALKLRIAARPCDHGTSVHVYEDGQILAQRWRPNVKVQTILVLLREKCARYGLRTCCAKFRCIENRVVFSLRDVLRSLPSGYM